MSLKIELLNKIPKPLKEEPQLHALLDHIKQNNIETKEHLADYLNKEIQIVERWLNDNKNQGTKNMKTIRNKVVHLDLLKKCFNITQEFLF